MLFLISLFISIVLQYLIIRYKNLHENFSGDYELIGPQKFHKNITPRIGGLGIYLTLWSSNLIVYFDDPSLGVFFSLLLLATLPVTLIGLLEDVTKCISVRFRLFGGFFSGVLFLYLFSITSIPIGIWGIDLLFQNVWVAGLFLCIACSGLSNAYNIIDGFNGLASMVGIIATTAIIIVAFKVGDLYLVFIALILIGATFGFFIWNYPRGLVFLGDGGAYLIGFLIATLSILLVHRNTTISPWFALVVNAYPIFETLFTIWRRLVRRGKNIGAADGKHFHSLIYRRSQKRLYPPNKHGSSSTQETRLYDLNNASTSPYLWILSSISTVPAIFFWQNTFLLILTLVIFVSIYIYCYRSIVHHHKPWWLMK